MNRALYALQAVLGSCRQRGPVTTARMVFHELRFDRRHGTSTSPVVDVAELRDTVGSHRDAAQPSQAVNPWVFRTAVAELRRPAAESVFVDFGAGRGRGLLLAAECGFKEIVGVEFSASLVAAARENLATIGRPEIQVVHADAAAFELPGDADVLFFFNPFGPPVMNAVVANIRRSLAVTPRSLTVIYVNPKHAELFLEQGFVEEPSASGARLNYRRFAGPSAG